MKTSETILLFPPHCRDHSCQLVRSGQVKPKTIKLALVASPPSQWSIGQVKPKTIKLALAACPPSQWSIGQVKPKTIKLALAACPPSQW